MSRGRRGSLKSPARHPSMQTETYPATVLLFALAAAVLVPYIVAPVGASLAGMAGSGGDASDPRSAGPSPLAGGVIANSQPWAARNATNLIADGSFDAITGPWSYTNGTTGSVAPAGESTVHCR